MSRNMLQVELRQVNVCGRRADDQRARRPLDALAPEHNLVRPGKDQVYRLQPGSEHSVAMNGSLPSQSR